MKDISRKATFWAMVLMLTVGMGSILSGVGQTGDKLAAAEQLYKEASELLAKNTKESLQTAKGKFKEASELYRAAGDKRREANSLYSLAMVFHNAGEASLAIDNYRQAATLYHVVNDKKWEAEAFSNMGILDSSLKDYKQALEDDRQALQLFQQLKDRAGEAGTLVNLGIDYHDLEDKQRPLEYFLQALNIYREIGSKEQEANTLAYLASFYKDVEKATDALKYYNDALAIYRALKNRSKEAETLNDLGNTYLVLDGKEKALEHFKQALAIYESLKDRNEEADTLLGIGTVYNTLLLPEKALSYLERAISIYRDTGESEKEGYALIFLSGIYSNLGEEEKAAEYTKQASAILKSDPNKAADALAPMITLMTLGGANDEEEAMDRVTALFSQFDRRLARLKDEPADDYVVRLTTAGIYHLLREENQSALEYLDRATEVAHAEGGKQGEGFALLFKGLAQGMSNQPTAVNTLQQASDIFHSLGYKDGEAAAMMFSAGIYGGLYEEEPVAGKRAEYLTQASSRLNQTLILFRTTKDKNAEAGILKLLMDMWEEEQKPELAIIYGKQAVNVLQGVRSELQDLDKKLQDSYLQRVVEIYQTLADILITQGRIAEAEQVLALLKEEEFFEYLRRDDKVAKELLGKLSLTPAEQAAFKRYEELADHLTQIGKELGELQAESQRYPVGKFPGQARLDYLEKQLADANQVFNAFLDELKIKFGANDSRVAEIESGTQALLKELHQPHTAIISTIAGHDRLNMIVTTAGAQRAHTVDIKAADLNRLVYEFREAVKNPRADPRPAGKRLYDVLFPADLQKDLDGIKADTIIWSLDGTLRYVPVAALWDGEKYLVERYANAVITLASRDKLSQTLPGRKERRALGVGVSKPFGTFSALPGVPEELCRVVNDPQAAVRCRERKGGIIAGRSLLNEEFTLPAFKAHLGRYTVIHIASHFSLNPGNEADSFLLLGGGKTDAERKLTLAGVRDQLKTDFVGVELLTLSACNTAMTAGAKSNGLEVEGFGALAQRQGAKAVLATLWAVADPSTRDLMAEFYRILETDKQLGKAETLRRAQLTLLKGKYKAGETPLWQRGSDIVGTQNDFLLFQQDPNAPFAHPYYWSPFVLFGNWR